jgi:hypothetical protein
VKSLSIKTTVDSEFEVVPILLPMFPIKLAGDMWTGAVDRPKGLPSKAMQCLRLRETGWVLEDVQQLICVLTGELRIGAKKVALTWGDSILIEKVVIDDDPSSVINIVLNGAGRVVAGDVPFGMTGEDRQYKRSCH